VTSKLSVITITFNNFEDLLNTTKSLVGINIEHNIVNGGTCPLTKNFLSSFDGNHLSEKDHGIADAFNKGLDISTGDFVTFLNSGDVLLDTEYYREAIEILEKNPDLAFVYADICFIDRYAGKIRIKSGNPLPSMSFLHPTLIIRKTLIKKIGPFKLEYKIAIDLDFVYRLVRSGAIGHYIPRMVVEMEGTGISSTNYSLNYVETAKIILRNKDYSWNSFKFLIQRSVMLVLKFSLLACRGDSLLKWYRRKRYRL